LPSELICRPARWKFYGFGFDNLTTRDYFQMAGRAGRRGLDREGFVYSRINPHLIGLDTLKRIVYGEAEPILSQFNASYATLLNLYKQLGIKLLEVYPRSFHYFQSTKKKHKRARLNIERKLNLLTGMGYIADERVTEKGEFALWMYGYELMLSELWELQFLNDLGPAELCVLLAALVYEPRKNESPPSLPKHFHHLEKTCRRVLNQVHRQEEHHHVFPPTKQPYFHLARAVEAWIGGCQFHQLASHTDVDEGIIIRYFRMVIQLLRQLKTDPNISDGLRETISKTMPLVNRDIVDAEKLLRGLGPEEEIKNE